ncbi:hypothetical protein A3C73_02600 [Candidatus Giovannonibacteria bacterium RIFCSPHIGHO2_02_FULL_44_11]|nr:MAG: hypothetical protein A3C73_02600 [Candidatus Giovannonibacteria bacterium RIFCSPHIGHO2_02_FULL_44_11]
MAYFAFSSATYIFSGIIVSMYALHYLRLFRKNGNEYSKMFFQLGCWVSFGFFLYGIPSLIYPEAHQWKGLLWFLASFCIVIGTIKPTQVALIAWENKFDKLAGLAIPSVAALIFLTHIFTIIPSPYTDNYGLIHWGIIYPFNFIIFMTGILITAIPAVFLFTAEVTGKKAAIKKTIFSITFLLGGLGGWGNILTNNAALLILSWSAMFFGFLLLGTMLIIEVVIKEPDLKKEEQNIKISQ